MNEQIQTYRDDIEWDNAALEDEDNMYREFIKDIENKIRMKEDTKTQYNTLVNAAVTILAHDVEK